MSAKKFIALAVSAICAGLTACSYVPLDESSARYSSASYTRSGSIEDARAYIYSGKTVIEFEQAEPLFLIVRDPNGNPVDAEKVGRLFRLGRNLDSFTIWLNGASSTFSAVPKTRIFSAPDAEPTPAEEKPAKLVAEAPARQAQALEADRRALALPMVVRVSFAAASADFKPSKEVASSLVAAAIAAQAVTVRGHTDSQTISPADTQIALARALAARRFLVEQGVDPKKIRTVYRSAAAFIAENNTPQGREKNRRVEIQFVEPSATKP